MTPPPFKTAPGRSPAHLYLILGDEDVDAEARQGVADGGRHEEESRVGARRS